MLMPIPWPDILFDNGLVVSKTEFKRLLKERAIKVYHPNGVIDILPTNYFIGTDEKAVILLEPKSIIKVGKRKFIKIVEEEII